MADLAIDLDVAYIRNAVEQMNNLAGVFARMSGVGGNTALAPIANPLGPLVNALASLPGAAGRAGQAIKLVTDGLTILFNTAMAGANAAIGFARNRFATGGTAGETYLTEILGMALGGSGAGIARALRQESLSGGLSTGIYAGLGFPIRPTDLGGGMNEAQAMLKLIGTLQAIYAREGEQGLTARGIRGTQMEQLLPIIEAGPEVLALMRAEAAERAKMYTPERVKQAMLLNLEMARLHRIFLDVATGLAFVFIPALENLLKVFTFGRYQGNFARDAQQALRQNTNALQNNTEVLRSMQGIWGGGAGARSAIPGAFGIGNGHALSNALRGHAIRFGAYAVSM